MRLMLPFYRLFAIDMPPFLLNKLVIMPPQMPPQTADIGL